MYKEYKAVGAEAHEVMTDIGSHLGGFFRAQESLEKHAEEQVEKAKKVASPDESLNEAALNRVLAGKRMQQMEVELREMLVYNAPKELGAIWSEFTAMRDTIRQEQAEAKRLESEKRQVMEWRRKRMREEIQAKAAWVGAVVFVLLYLVAVLIGLHLTIHPTLF
jgi:GrpB-like predicted nucleotidyltransferase (UPF0157 family)